jgi:cytochrome c
LKENALDTFELNKIAGACLGTLLFAMSLSVASGAIFSRPALKKAGYNLPAAPERAQAQSRAPAAAPIEERLATADPKKGEADTRPCQACHNFEKGAAIKIGPPLYGIVDRPKGSVEGFDYSDAIKSKGGKWTDADLDDFLTNPRAYAPGTKMTFAGISNPAERADVIAYLHTLSDHPVPLPKPAAAKPAAKVALTPPAAAPIGEPQAKAGSESGETAIKPCQACHTFEEGAGIKIGPPLYGVAGRPKASVQGFDYSDALKSKGGTWTDADLDQFLANPNAYAPGTKMTFAGVADPGQRAVIIAYLHKLAAKPAPALGLVAPAGTTVQPAAPVKPPKKKAGRKRGKHG